MKIIFMGTPDFAVPILEALNEKYEIALVVSQPDKEVGRKRILTHPPVVAKALELGLKVYQPYKLRDDYKEIIDAKADMIVTAAYGQIVPDAVLNSVSKSINVHGSLLPKYRGGAPIHRSIINGDKVTGITIMYMDEGMDTGDIISKREVVIEEYDNLETLSDKLSVCGTKLLLETIPDIIDGKNDRIKQDDKLVSYAYNISPEDEHIDFNNSSEDIYNLIRGLSPNIGAYFLLDGERFKVYKAKIGTNKLGVGKISIYKDSIGIGTKDNEILLLEVQPMGKKKMDIKSFLNGINKEEFIKREIS